MTPKRVSELLRTHLRSRSSVASNRLGFLPRQIISKITDNFSFSYTSIPDSASVFGLNLPSGPMIPWAFQNAHDHTFPPYHYVQTASMLLHPQSIKHLTLSTVRQTLLERITKEILCTTTLSLELDMRLSGVELFLDSVALAHRGILLSLQGIWAAASRPMDSPSDLT